MQILKPGSIDKQIYTCYPTVGFMSDHMSAGFVFRYLGLCFSLICLPVHFFDSKSRAGTIRSPTRIRTLSRHPVSECSASIKELFIGPAATLAAFAEKETHDSQMS